MICQLARAFHSVFPFSELRTAKKLNRPGLRLCRSLFGYEISLNTWLDSALMLVYLRGEGAIEDVGFLRPFVHPENTVLDVGANVGYMTLFFCRQVGPNGRVYAFEPEEKLMEELKGNLQRNAIQQCIPVQKFVSDTSDKSLDELLRGVKVDLVKIDVEGHELQVLRGMREIIDHNRPILFVEVHPFSWSGCDHDAVYSFLKERYPHAVAYPDWSEVRPSLKTWEVIAAGYRSKTRVRMSRPLSLEAIAEHPNGRFHVLGRP